MTVPSPNRPRYRVRRLSLRSTFDWLGPKNRAAVTFLDELADYGDTLRSSSQWNPYWLVPFRDDFRNIIRDTPVAGLRAVVARDSPQTRTIAIWLISRTANRYNTLGLAKYLHGADPALRKHLTRALKRLGTWIELDAGLIESAEQPGTFIPIGFDARRIVEPAPPKPYAQRMQRFLDRSADVPNARDKDELSEAPLWYRDWPWEGTPARTVEMIRRALMRIRRWVHGSGFGG